MKTRLTPCLLLFATIITLSLTIGCSKAVNDYNEKPIIGGIQGANEVWIQGSGFIPTSLTVEVNTIVYWTNKDSKDHTVTSDDANGFDSGNIEPGSDYNHQFTSRGIFPYHCKYNFKITGTIIVQ
jgi:plastocyanin